MLKPPEPFFFEYQPSYLSFLQTATLCLSGGGDVYFPVCCFVVFLTE